VICRQKNRGDSGEALALGTGVGKAFEHMEANRHLGKIVVTL
jgi:hypothetical protein